MSFLGPKKSARVGETYEFVEPSDDTPENRAVAALVEERRQRGRTEDRDLDDVIAEFGFEPAEFLRR